MSKVVLNFTSDITSNNLEFKNHHKNYSLSQPFEDSFTVEKPENKGVKSKNNNHTNLVLGILGIAAAIIGIILLVKNHKKPQSEIMPKAAAEHEAKFDRWVGDRTRIEALQLPTELKSIKEMMEPRLDAFRNLISNTESIDLKNAQGKIIGQIRRNGAYNTKVIYYHRTEKPHILTEFTSDGYPKNTVEYDLNRNRLTEITYGGERPISIRKIDSDYNFIEYELTREGSWYISRTDEKVTENRRVMTIYRKECPTGIPKEIWIFDKSTGESQTTKNRFDANGKLSRARVITSKQGNTVGIQEIQYLNTGHTVIINCDSHEKELSRVLKDSQGRTLQTLEYPNPNGIVIPGIDEDKFVLIRHNLETGEATREVFDTRPEFPAPAK